MQFKKILLSLLTGMTMLSLTACGNTSNSKAPQKINVSAAASLAGVLAKLKPIAQKQIHLSMQINAAASGALAQQILQGAPVDLFISANARWMDELEKKKYLATNTRVNIAGNQLVLIASDKLKNPPTTLPQLAKGTQKIAIGDPAYVPAGQYAKTSLINAGLWKKIKPRIVPTVDVTAALVSVQTGAAPLGFVYATDAQGAIQSHTYKIALTVPDKLHKPIVYPAAVIKNSAHAKAAERLLKFLQSPKAQKIFSKARFSTTAPSK